MLVLSRQLDESIVIGDNITVTVVDIRGDKVRLGINAPTEVPVHRQEVYNAIKREHGNVSAYRVGDNPLANPPAPLCLEEHERMRKAAQGLLAAGMKVADLATLTSADHWLVKELTEQQG